MNNLWLNIYTYCTIIFIRGLKYLISCKKVKELEKEVI